ACCRTALSRRHASAVRRRRHLKCAFLPRHEGMSERKVHTTQIRWKGTPASVRTVILPEDVGQNSWWPAATARRRPVVKRKCPYGDRLSQLAHRQAAFHRATSRPLFPGDRRHGGAARLRCRRPSYDTG